MKNPFYKLPIDVAFDRAAALVCDYLAANADKPEFAEVDLLAAPEIRAIFDANKSLLPVGAVGLPDGYRAEVRQRVLVLVIEMAENERLAQQAAAVDRRAAELLTS